MDFSVLVLTIIKLAILIATGMLVTYKIPFTQEIRSFLVFIIINIAVPAMILNGFFSLKIDQHILKQMIIIFIFSIGFHLIGLMIGWLVSKGVRLDSNKARETSVLSIFGNTGLIGIPLCASLFGAKGAVFAAVFDAGMCFLLWTVGILIIQGKKNISFQNIKSMIAAPNISVLIGLSLTILNIEPGYLVKDVSAALAGIASPLAMIYVGMLTMSIIKQKRKVSLKLLTLPVTLKLFIFPLIGLIVLYFIDISHEVEHVLLIEMTMPALTTGSIIFALYNADEDFAVMDTLFTTLLSLGSIPFIILLGGLWL